MIGFQTRCLRNKYSLTKNNVLSNLRVSKGLVLCATGCFRGEEFFSQLQ